QGATRTTMKAGDERQSPHSGAVEDRVGWSAEVLTQADGPGKPSSRCRLQMRARPANFVFAVLRRLAIPQGCAAQSDRERIVSFHTEAGVREFRRVQRF